MSVEGVKLILGKSKTIFTTLSLSDCHENILRCLLLNPNYDPKSGVPKYVIYTVQ